MPEITEKVSSMKIRTIGFAAVAAFTLAASVLIAPAAWGTATSVEPITVADGPVAVAFSPNGRFAYVLSAENIRVLSKIDVASGAVIDTLDLSGDGRASTLAVSPDGTVAYVTFETVSIYIEVIDLGTFELRTPIALDNHAYGVAFSSDSETAYATLRDSDLVAIIDVSEGEVSDTFSLGTSPVNIAIAPNDSILLVGANGSEDDGSVWVRNVANDANVAQITVGARPTSIVITPDGTKAYVGDARGEVSVISLSSYDVITTFEAPEPGYEFTKLAMSPDGTKAFFALNYSISLFVIDVATDALESSTALLGEIPHDLAISPAETSCIPRTKTAITCLSFEWIPASPPSG
jgi:WD40 repeat protein